MTPQEKMPVSISCMENAAGLCVLDALNCRFFSNPTTHSCTYNALSTVIRPSLPSRQIQSSHVHTHVVTHTHTDHTHTNVQTQPVMPSPSQQLHPEAWQLQQQKVTPLPAQTCLALQLQQPPPAYPQQLHHHMLPVTLRCQCCWWLMA